MFLVVRASGTFYPISTLPPVSVDQRCSPSNHVILTGTIRVLTNERRKAVVSNQALLTPQHDLTAKNNRFNNSMFPTFTHAKSLEYFEFLALSFWFGVSDQTFDPQSAPSTTLYGPELSCSRPFCKLKRKPHYHCNTCNQAFSELDKLLPHVARHSNSAFHQGSNTSPGTAMDSNNADRDADNYSEAKEDRRSTPESSMSETQKISVASLSSLQGNQVGKAYALNISKRFSLGVWCQVSLNSNLLRFSFLPHFFLSMHQAPWQSIFVVLFFFSRSLIFVRWDILDNFC